MDAFTIAKDAFGFLLNRGTREEAFSLQAALRGEGYETEVIAEADLVQLPASKFTNRIDCTPEALMVYDPIGRPFGVPWEHILLVAAGMVMHTEIKRVEREIEAAPDPDGYGGYQPMPRIEYTSKEERTLRFMLDIVLTRAVLRYTLNVDSRIAFLYLGARASMDFGTNATLVMQDIARFAPQAALNRGAYYFREGAGGSLSYPSRGAFQEETSWLLWQMKKAGKL